MSDKEQFLWVEKYRPSDIGECILTPQLKEVFSGIIKDGDIPNMLLCGSSGIGKTTVAKALCNQMGVDYMFVNASVERGIDITRTNIKTFASKMSMLYDESDRRKIVILDEADQLTSDAQPAFRAFMEEYSSNCGFIFTCNFPGKIIDAIHSRCTVIDFKLSSTDRKAVMIEYAKRACEILKKEDVGYDKKAVVGIIKKFFPDFRRTLNELYRYSRANNSIDGGILAIAGDLDANKLIEALRGMNYSDIREWVVENLDKDPIMVYQKIYHAMKSFMDNENLAQAVIILADYQYKSSFSADQELNLLACLTELMVNCEVK